MGISKSEICAIRGVGDQHLTLAGWLRPHLVPAQGLEVSGQGSGRDVSPHNSGNPPPAALLWGESRQPLLLFLESAEHWTWWHEAFCLGFDRMRQGPKSAGRPGPPVMRSDSPQDVSLPLSCRLCAIFNTDAPTAAFVSELPLKTVCMLRDTMGEKTLQAFAQRLRCGVDRKHD